jgi:hypothetical protein
MYDGLATDVVIVVQNKDERLFDRFENLVYQQIRSAFRGFGNIFISLREIWQERFAKTGFKLADTVSYVRKKRSGVSVGVIHLVPDRRPLLRTKETGDQRGLAAARVGGDQRNRGIQV